MLEDGEHIVGVVYKLYENWEVHCFEPLETAITDFQFQIARNDGYAKKSGEKKLMDTSPIDDTEDAISEDSEFEVISLADKIDEFEEHGYLHFKKKAYKEAILQFSDGIDLFKACGKPMENPYIKTKIILLYTNRSLAFHHLDQQASALEDANTVLNELDSNNQKALFRRSHANKCEDKF